MSECEACGELHEHGEVIYDIGFVCQDCLDNCENITGYCSMACQLFKQCDGAC